MAEKRMNLDISKLEYVLFDWDNTLAESRTALVTVVNQVLKEYNLPSWDVVAAKRDRNLSFRDNFPNIFGADKAEKAYERYAGLYAAQVSGLISTFPCVKETLDYFKSRGKKIMIMSNKDRRLLELELPMILDKGYFTRIVCGHEAKRDKPWPEHAFYALEGYLRPEEISREKVWIVGDSKQDSDCARAAGALPIRIGQPVWRDDCRREEGVFYYNDFRDFFNALSQ